MKALLRWLAKIIGSALTIILVIILFPYISNIAAKLLPDESGAAIKASAILACKLENSARLETLRVVEDGVLSYDIKPAFLPPVANINASYKYEASFGIDLSKVNMQVSGNHLIFLLPAHEILQDSLTPNEVNRDDFWYIGFTDNDYEKLLETERISRRNIYLSGEKEQILLDATVSAFEKTISSWLTNINSQLKISYKLADEVNAP